MKAWKIMSGMTLLTLCILGCGKGDPEQDDFHPVKGKVMIDGKPMTSGRIEFFPEIGAASASDIGPNGEFELKSKNDIVGALEGTHKVVVNCPPDFGSTGSAASGETKSKKAGGKCRIADKFTGVGTTPLTFEVKSGGHDDVEIKVSAR